MYDGILHKPLPLPPGKSDAVTSLLVGLLQKDQHRRLGAIADFVSVLPNFFFFFLQMFRWFLKQEISLVIEKGCFQSTLLNVAVVTTLIACVGIFLN